MNECCVRICVHRAALRRRATLGWRQSHVEDRQRRRRRHHRDRAAWRPRWRKFGERFLGRVYTRLEVAACRGRVNELAARFAAKEAVMKALGTGAHGVAWREIEVLPNHRGKPLVYLHGRGAERAEQIGLRGLDISMSHSRDSPWRSSSALAGPGAGPRRLAREARPASCASEGCG